MVLVYSVCISTEQNVFKQLCQYGLVERDESWQAFNMGVGMILVVSPEAGQEFFDDLTNRGHSPFFMGEITDKEGIEWLD